MIVVDTSALVAVAFAEREREEFVGIIEASGKALISSISVVEARMVVYGRRGHLAVVMLDDLLRLRAFESVAPSQTETDAAYAAFVAYGKGSGHPAGLNYGDILSCALSKVRSLPLLFKGDDLAQTDIVRAI